MRTKPTYVVLVGAALGLIAVLLFSAGGEQSSEVATHSDLPFLMDDGSTQSLSDFQGKPLVLNFFASWCPPCRAEMPDFEAVYQEQGSEVAFLGIDQDIDEATWKSFVAGTVVTFPTAFADFALYESFGGIGMPTTVFLSADGEVLFVQTGALSKSGLEAKIGELFS